MRVWLTHLLRREAWIGGEDDPLFMRYANEEGKVEALLTDEEWKKLGTPELLTVTFQAGNHLENPRGDRY